MLAQSTDLAVSVCTEYRPAMLQDTPWKNRICSATILTYRRGSENIVRDRRDRETSVVGMEMRWQGPAPTQTIIAIPAAKAIKIEIGGFPRIARSDQP